MAERLSASLKRRFPGLQVVGTYTPPFRSLTPEEEKSALTQILESRPHILWVGLGTPKQERFMAQYTDRLQVPLMVGVGAAFDYHTGSIRDCSPWVKRAGMQWFHRLLQDPKRLSRRYLGNIPVFLWHIAFCQFMRLRRYPAGPESATDVAPIAEHLGVQSPSIVLRVEKCLLRTMIGCRVSHPTVRGPMSVNRREFLRGAAGVSAAALASTVSCSRVQVNPGVLPNPEFSGIEHVVVVMMENRSFDHMLGWLPNANGRQAGFSYLDNNGNPQPTARLDFYVGCSHPDPDHTYAGGRTELNGGKMDGWLRTGTNDGFSVKATTKRRTYHSSLRWRAISPPWITTSRRFLLPPLPTASFNMRRKPTG